MATAEVTLPGGVWVGGERRQDAVLREVTGADEASLAELAARSPAARAQRLLERCLVGMAGVAPVPPARIAALTVGDAQALFLHLRRMSFGDTLEGVVACASEACGEKLDFAVRVRELLVAPYASAAPVHEESIDGHLVRFRLPILEDQAIAASQVREHPGEAEATLLRRCVEAVTNPEGARVEPPWPPALAEAVATRMADLDPQAEIRLAFTCPKCGHRVAVLLDAANFLLAELTGQARALDEDVHRLALHYHWGEAEILGLPVVRRRKYLDLLAGHLAGATR
jgi:hypothetical protein